MFAIVRKTFEIMMRKLLLGLLVAMTISIKAQYGPYVVPNLDWVQNYGNTTTPSLSAVASEVDAAKNIYVVGTYQGATKDLAVIKYDSSGVFQWAQLYNNGGDDYGNAITVNKSTGDVFVCGKSYGTATTLYDYIVIKYSSSGVQTWAKRVNLNNGDDEATDIEIDASSNVFVTGNAFKGGTHGKDMYTVKFTATGTQTWTSLYDGGTGNDDYGTSLVLSSSGNSVYVAGNKGISAGVNDIVVQGLKASGGGAVWTYTANGTASGNDVSNQIILAGANVVVCGQIVNTPTNEDYTTIKLNGSTGAVIFKKDYDSGNNTNYATSLCRDSTGNIAVVGRLFNGTYNEYHTVLYDSTGTKLWSNMENTFIGSGNIYPRISTDTIANHFYVVGEKMRSTNDIFVYQVTPTGNTSWREYYDRGGYDAGLSLSVNGYGQLYIAAITTNGGAGYDITTIKISQTPEYTPIDFNNINEPFSRSHLFYPNNGEILTADSALAATEVAYYTRNCGPAEYMLNNNKMAFVFAKMDTTKNHSGVDSTHRVDLSFYHGNSLTVPHAINPQDTGYLNYFLAQRGGDITNVKGNAQIMIPNIYPSIDVHFYSNSSGLKIYFVVKPGANPNAIKMHWESASSTTITGGNQMKINTALGNFAFNQPKAYWVDNNLNTYSTTCSYTSLGSDMYGVSTGTFNQAWPLVIQINQGAAVSPSIGLNVNWSTFFGGNLDDKIYKSKSDANNNLFVCGKTISNLNFPQVQGANVFQSGKIGYYDGFISKFKPNGQHWWTTFVGGELVDYLHDLDFDGTNLYAVGSTNSFSLQTGIKAGAYNDATFAGGNDDGFILQTDMNGTNKTWLTYFGYDGDDLLQACKLDGSGNLFIVGASSSTSFSPVNPGGAYSQTYNPVQSQLPFTDVYDAIIMKFAAGTSTLNWFTYYGTYTLSGLGLCSDLFYGIDISGTDVYVCGSSGGTGLPGSINSKFNPNYMDGIIAKFTTAGALTTAKYTDRNDINNSIKVHNGKVYACGQTRCVMTVSNSGQYYYQSTCSGGYDGCFSVYNPSLTTLHATYLGGSTWDHALDLQFGPSDVFYISGGTSSNDFPTAYIANTYYMSNMGGNDYFLTAFKEGINSMVWGTCLGSPEDETDQLDDAASIAIDGNNKLHLCGSTASWSLFPLDDGGGPPVYFQAVRAGGMFDPGDCSITRFDLGNISTYVGIKENQSPINSIQVYPNPTAHSLMLNEPELNGERISYSIYNTTGQMLKEGFFVSQNEEKIDVSSLPQGFYILHLKAGQRQVSVKFIKAGQ
jgi:hypothetical protein